MEDWWKTVFDQFSNPSECLELGFTCKRANAMLRTCEPKFRTFYSNKKDLLRVLHERHCTYVEIETFDSMSKIRNLYCNSPSDNSQQEPSTVVEYNYFGLYHDLAKQMENAKTCYSKSANLGFPVAMYNLSLIYSNEGNRELWKKYLRCAVEKGFCPAINRLAIYYETRRKFIKMEKYYMMAIEKGNYDELDRLARHYTNRFKDDANALKLYELDSSTYQSEILSLRQKMSLDCPVMVQVE